MMDYLQGLFKWLFIWMIDYLETLFKELLIWMKFAIITDGYKFVVPTKELYISEWMNLRLGWIEDRMNFKCK